MRIKIFFVTVISLLLSNCGGSGSSLPPFEYGENSRIILEGILQNPDGSPAQNQPLELQAYRYDIFVVNSTFSDGQGKFFISAPKSNYEYSLVFNNKNIISMQTNQSLLIENKDIPPFYYGVIPKLIKNYYDFKIIKITSL